MRELTRTEITEVSGGELAFGLSGAVMSGYTSYLNESSWQTTLESAALGGSTGATTKDTSGFVNLNYAVRSAGLWVGSRTASGRSTLDVKDLEKELES